MLLLVPKGLTFCFILAVTYVFIVIAMIGKKPDQPLSGCRYYVMTTGFSLCMRLMGVFGLWTWFSCVLEEDVDYTQFLGANAGKPRSASVKDHAPTVVSNHTGAFEIWGLMTSANPPCFAAKEAVKKWPIAGKLNDALETMYLSKGGSTIEEREKCIGEIV
jgi:hypothetical protein